MSQLPSTASMHTARSLSQSLSIDLSSVDPAFPLAQRSQLCYHYDGKTVRPFSALLTRRMYDASHTVLLQLIRVSEEPASASENDKADASSSSSSGNSAGLLSRVLATCASVLAHCRNSKPNKKSGPQAQYALWEHWLEPAYLHSFLKKEISVLHELEVKEKAKQRRYSRNEKPHPCIPGCTWLESWAQIDAFTGRFRQLTHIEWADRHQAQLPVYKHRFQFECSESELPLSVELAQLVHNVSSGCCRHHAQPMNAEAIEAAIKQQQQKQTDKSEPGANDSQSPASATPSSSTSHTTDSSSSSDALKKFSFPLPFIEYDDDHGSNSVRQPILLNEIALCNMLAALREKADWHRKVRNPLIRQRWSVEASVQQPSLSSKSVEYGMQELEWWAEQCEAADSKGQPFYVASGVDGVWQSDNAIQPQLNTDILTAIQPLESVPDSERDYHPGSHKQVINLVHPSLYCYRIGASRVTQQPFALSECMSMIGQGQPIPIDSFEPPVSEAEAVAEEGAGVSEDEMDEGERKQEAAVLRRRMYFRSTHSYGVEYASSDAYAWLPAEFEVSPDGQHVSIQSYINNLHPHQHASLYTLLASAMQRLLPMFERVLTQAACPPQQRMAGGYWYREYLDRPYPPRDSVEERLALWACRPTQANAIVAATAAADAEPAVSPHPPSQAIVPAGGNESMPGSDALVDASGSRTDGDAIERVDYMQYMHTSAVSGEAKKRTRRLSHSEWINEDALQLLLQLQDGIAYMLLQQCCGVNRQASVSERDERQQRVDSSGSSPHPHPAVSVDESKGECEAAIFIEPLFPCRLQQRCGQLVPHAIIEASKAENKLHSARVEAHASVSGQPNEHGSVNGDESVSESVNGSVSGQANEQHNEPASTDTAASTGVAARTGLLFTVGMAARWFADFKRSLLTMAAAGDKRAEAALHSLPAQLDEVQAVRLAAIVQSFTSKFVAAADEESDRYITTLRYIQAGYEKDAELCALAQSILMGMHAASQRKWMTQVAAADAASSLSQQLPLTRNGEEVTTAELAEACGEEEEEESKYDWHPGREGLMLADVTLPFPHPPPFHQLPAAERVSLAGRRLQVIVKLANIELTPDKPQYEGGSWHVEGMENESIVASGIVYLYTDNITDSYLSFRHACKLIAPEQDDSYSPSIAWGLSRDGQLCQQLGSVHTKAGRAVCFPNIFQHQVQPFELKDNTRKGVRKILVFFLVDPNIRIVSSATVPPQQRQWHREYQSQVVSSAVESSSGLIRDVAAIVADYAFEADGTIDHKSALRHRRKLMKERKYFVQENNEQLFERPYSFCEH